VRQQQSKPISGAHPQRGLSLVELMVGLVVAMAAVIVVMQVFQLSEGNRRSTTGGGDAQTSGAIALTLLQQDLRQAGLGISSLSLLNCNLTLGAGRVLNNLGPVTLNHPDIPAGDAGSDTLVVAYGSGEGSPTGDQINGQPDGNTYEVGQEWSFATNEYVIPVVENNTGGACGTATLARVTAKAAAGVGGAGTVTVSNGTAGIGTGGILYNLGLTPRVHAYAVRGGRLTRCDFMLNDCRVNNAANWIEIADGIVALRVQYGRDSSAPRDTVLDLYDQTTPTTGCEWSRVIAVRLALVARSGQFNKDEVDQPDPSWAGSETAPIGLGEGWKHYRYKTFETLLPLRNMPSAGVDAAMDSVC
jgi:type IV pilus assembly protein PilW